MGFFCYYLSYIAFIPLWVVPCSRLDSSYNCNLLTFSKVVITKFRCFFPCYYWKKVACCSSPCLTNLLFTASLNVQTDFPVVVCLISGSAVNLPISIALFIKSPFHQFLLGSILSKN